LPLFDETADEFSSALRSYPEVTDLAATAREIIDASLYMVLGTADENGRPWVSPVYFASRGYTDFYWVSLPDAQHSRNLAGRPEVSIVVFDSSVPIGTGQGVYMSARAEEQDGDELERGIEVFARRTEEHGGRSWSADDVRTPAPHRLYRSSVDQHWLLDKEARPGDRRTAVTP
jgi:nitroimidazol reductase NimA-like FMN-containing flavoprotein (pyridoxamine 5'-phosphate oxidase superfamily)